MLCDDSITTILTIGDPVPLGVAAAVAQASIYDVPGGYRAVMFDRFSGVKGEVCRCILKVETRR